MFIYRMRLRYPNFKLRRVKGFGLCSTLHRAETFARKFAQNKHDGQKFWI